MSAVPIPAAVDVPAPRRPLRSRPAARPSARRRPSARTGIRGGVVWIVAFAVLLAGVVALNVAVLQLNLRLDRLTNERADLKARNAALAGRLAGARSPHELERLARARLGLVEAKPEQTSYVALAR